VGLKFFKNSFIVHGRGGEPKYSRDLTVGTSSISQDGIHRGRYKKTGDTVENQAKEFSVKREGILSALPVVNGRSTKIRNTADDTALRVSGA